MGAPARPSGRELIAAKEVATMAGRLATVHALANVRGDVERLTEALAAIPADDASAVVLVGDISSDGSAESFRAVLRTLGEADQRVYWVPGASDAPVTHFLRESYNVEVVFPKLRNVHGTFAFAPGYVLLAGMGGEITDDPEAAREERERLRYPGWEAELRFKPLAELDDHPRLFLFSTRPRHKGQQEQGSQTVAELINTFRPRTVIVPAGGGDTWSELLGSSHVVSVADFATAGPVAVDVTTGEVVSSAVSPS